MTCPHCWLNVPSKHGKGCESAVCQTVRAATSPVLVLERPRPVLVAA
jgi:hypothetical protein